MAMLHFTCHTPDCPRATTRHDRHGVRTERMEKGTDAQVSASQQAGEASRKLRIGKGYDLSC